MNPAERAVTWIVLQGGFQIVVVILENVNENVEKKMQADQGIILELMFVTTVNKILRAVVM